MNDLILELIADADITGLANLRTADPVKYDISMHDILSFVKLTEHPETYREFLDITNLVEKTA